MGCEPVVGGCPEDTDSKGIPVCVCLEGENWLSSATEETQVPQRPGPGTRRTGDRVPQDAGPGTAEYDRRTDQSESALHVDRTAPLFLSVIFHCLCLSRVCIWGKYLHKRYMLYR